MGKQAFFHKLSYKFTFGFLLMAVLISITSCVIGYVKYKSTIEKQYNDHAYQIAAVAASYVEGDKVERYLSTMKTDEDYDSTAKQLNRLRVNTGANYIYLAKLDGINLTYVFDADNDKDSFEPFQLGDTGTINPEFAEDAKIIVTTGARVNNYFYSHSQFGYNTSAIVPVYNGKKDIVAIIGVEIAMSLLQSTLREYLLVAGVFSTLLTFLFLTAYLIYLRRRVVNPMKDITLEAYHFVGSGHKISNALQNIQTGDEIETLALSMYQMELEINSYIENLTKMTAEKERIATELNVAKQIQASMLPCIFPPFPERSEFEIYATMQPAKEVGGDFYDFYLVDSNHLCVIIADVSGKGVPAALFMVIAKTLIKNQAQLGRQPAEVFTAVNAQLCETNEAELFVTAWMGVLEIDSGRLTFVNAGHNPPLIKKASGDVRWVQTKPGLVLAAMEGIRYTQSELQLDAGDMLYLYTDGVTEALNPQNELFGNDRLYDALVNMAADVHPGKLLSAVRNSCDQFADSAEQADDITMLALRYLGKNTAQNLLSLVEQLQHYNSK